MRNTTVFLILVILLLFLSCFFYTVESFVNNDSFDSIIFIKEPGPFDSLQIRYDHDRDNKDRNGDQNYSMLHLTELVIFDKNNRRIPYWNHQVYFDGGSWPNYPVNNLWDDNMDSFGSSRGPRSNLIVNFRSPQEISSVQLTNRRDCCPDRIQNYNLVLYKGNRAIGTTSLYQLGWNRKTVNYIVVNETAKGDNGPNGDRGLKGPSGPQGIPGHKGDKGDRGLQGDQGNTGVTGVQGPKGDIGPIGGKGDIGPTGAIGPQGIQGIQGIPGPEGIQGISGTRGQVGVIGLEGIAGENCPQ